MVVADILDERRSLLNQLLLLLRGADGRSNVL